MIEIHYNTKSSFNCQFIKQHNALLQKKYYNIAIDHLYTFYGRLSADCYNRAISSLLMSICLAQAGSSFKLTPQGYELLAKLPMYRDMSDGTRTINDLNKQLKLFQ